MYEYKLPPPPQLSTLSSIYKVHWVRGGNIYQPASRKPGTSYRLQIHYPVFNHLHLLLCFIKRFESMQLQTK